MMREPVIAVGLVDNADDVTLRLQGAFADSTGTRFGPGEYRFSCADGMVAWAGAGEGSGGGLTLTADTPASTFALQVTIGIDFHWQQKQEQAFGGGVRVLPRGSSRLLIINDVPMETYIRSVSCSEMNADSPEEFLKAHSIISRSWLLAQLESKGRPAEKQPDSTGDEIIRWYDRESHLDFDVCADDHCQRYQGIGMITGGAVSEAIDVTRGNVLTYDGQPCDARFSKCCGGVTEDFRLAWGNTAHPYLVPLPDGPSPEMPSPPLSDERAVRAYLTGSPDAYCNCTDESILDRVLNNYDRSTPDFFRWQVRLTAKQVGELLQSKLGIDVGRVLALEPVTRGLSARLERLRMVGDARTVIIGKELEIRRALSESHLYSSAFVVDTEGSPSRPDAFVLHGAGWGHGVGLCQIGAAVMACRGIGHEEILRHYYPGSVLERLYD